MEYIVMFVAGLLGVLLHALVKIQGINKRTPTYNFKLVMNEYWRSDWPTFAISVIVVFAGAFVSDEVIRSQAEDLPKTMGDFFVKNIEGHVKLYFIGLGYLADSLLYMWLGRAEKNIKVKVEEEQATPPPSNN